MAAGHAADLQGMGQGLVHTKIVNAGWMDGGQFSEGPPAPASPVPAWRNPGAAVGQGVMGWPDDLPVKDYHINSVLCILHEGYGLFLPLKGTSTASAGSAARSSARNPARLWYPGGNRAVQQRGLSCLTMPMAPPKHS